MTTRLAGDAAACAAMIGRASHIGILSGAGLSTNAGIPDFRGPNGLYRKAGIENPERIFDIDTFRRDPSLFYRFHRTFLEVLEHLRPTFTHRFLAALERTGKMRGIVTQNIDSLHQRAGSRNVLEIHGGIWHSNCTTCLRTYAYEEATRRTFSEEIPHCACGGVLKPDIVFFGEMVKLLDECEAVVRDSDLFFVLGSSLQVTPAAMLPTLASGDIVVVNQGDVSSTWLPPQRISLLVDEDLDAFFREMNRYLRLIPLEDSYEAEE